MPNHGDEVKVQFSKLKVLWPQTKENPSLTKKDLIDYYENIDLYILPYLKDRTLYFVIRMESTVNLFFIEIGKVHPRPHMLQV